MIALAALTGVKFDSAVKTVVRAAQWTIQLFIFFAQGVKNKGILAIWRGAPTHIILLVNRFVKTQCIVVAVLNLIH